MPTRGRFKFVVWGTHADVFPKLLEMHDKYEWVYHHAAQEYAPTTGKGHIDGYYEMQENRTWKCENKKFVKKFGTGYGDLRAAKGTAGENVDYSEKEDREQQTRGEPLPGAGARTDLKETCDAIKTGELTVDQIAVDNPQLYHQYGRTFQKCEDIALRSQFRTEMPVTKWIYGDTGVGKSHMAFEGYHPTTHYVWKNDKGWQDGYTGQPTVIINDFRGCIPFGELLQMCDKWPYFVPRRGREPAPFLATEIIITSSMQPRDVYKNIDSADSLAQLYRRIQVIFKYKDGFLDVTEEFRSPGSEV